MADIAEYPLSDNLACTLGAISTCGMACETTGDTVCPFHVSLMRRIGLTQQGEREVIVIII